MIWGIGTDILNQERVHRVWKKHGQSFEKRILSRDERQNLPLQEAKQVTFLAKSFAAKEALFKALRLERGCQLSWHDMIVLMPEGKTPSFLQTPWLSAYFQRVAPGKHAHFHLSFSHDTPWVLAFVVVELSLS